MRLVCVSSYEFHACGKFLVKVKGGGGRGLNLPARKRWMAKKMYFRPGVVIVDSNSIIRISLT